MGELLFCFGYGGSLIILGLITKFFVGRMEKDVVTTTTISKDEKAGM
ncbi:hypothetical protein [Bacillus sp. UNC438CL73TsuS30]|nr:hypothetical protein [Bacillus sp. UNC438CL73TsuS30]